MTAALCGVATVVVAARMAAAQLPTPKPRPGYADLLTNYFIP